MNIKGLNKEEIGLSGDEQADRLIIQRALDEGLLVPPSRVILYEGNRVWSRNLIIDEYERLRNLGTLETMSDEFYAFLHLCCGSIAHYSKAGWVEEYDNSIDLLHEFFRCNEFGQDIFEYQSARFTDRRKIASLLLRRSNERGS